MNTGSNTPTGNVVVDPDSAWNADGSKKDPSGHVNVNPNNINEDLYKGDRIKGRKKFGKMFDDEAQATIAQEQADAAALAADTFEDEDIDPAVADLLDGEDEDEQLGEELNLDDVGVVLQEIKILSGAVKGGDAKADETLLTILQAEYARPDGGRQRIKGALSALGYKKPGR
jgi:hypothetical protein